MSISIIIPVYNNSHFTQSCINDLKKLTTSDTEIIFIDNGSTDNTQNILDEAVKENDWFFSYTNTENKYFAKACNKGFEKCMGDNILFLNNDIRVKSNHEDWILQLVEACQDGSVVGPTGGLLGTDFHFIRHTNEMGARTSHFYISAWCIMSQRETWEKLILPGEEGPFSSEFGLFFEDSDLGKRCVQQNIPLKIVPVPVIHIGHATAKKLDMGRLYQNAHSIFAKKWENNG
jgi:glycosyltransferase involved in cell wall biosynthesis